MKQRNVKWHKRNDLPKPYSNIFCLTYRKNRIRNRWNIYIGTFDPDKYFRHDDSIPDDPIYYSRVETGFDDWIYYKDVLYWCYENELLNLIKKLVL